ncbi:MAG: hypothetical protein NVSMB32_11110 [Actinomycetota bacterium]
MTVPGITRALAAAVLTAMVASACAGHSSGTASGSAITLDVLSGSAAVVGGGATRTVTSHAAVNVGDRISPDSAALAVLHLGPGKTFELMAGETLITAQDRLQVVRGSALGILTSHGEIDAEGLTVTSDAATMRVDAGAASRLAVYGGSATIATPGGSLVVPAYREALAQSGLLERSVKPLALTKGGDTWDHRYLQDAIDLDERLNSFGGGLDAQLGNASGLAFFQLVIPDYAQVAYVAPFFAKPRSEVLIGYVIARHAASALHRDSSTTFNQVMELRAAGETWGILAKEFGVSADDVFAGLLDAIHRVGITATTPTPQFFPALTPVLPPPAPAAAGAPQAAPRPTPAITPTPAPSPELVPTLLAPVTQLLNGVLGLLFPQPTQTVTPGG